MFLERAPDGFLVLEVDTSAHRLGGPVEPTLACRRRVLVERDRQQLGHELTERLSLAALAVLQAPEDGGVDIDRRSRHMRDASNLRIRCATTRCAMPRSCTAFRARRGWRTKYGVVLLAVPVVDGVGEAEVPPAGTDLRTVRIHDAPATEGREDRDA